MTALEKLIAMSGERRLVMLIQTQFNNEWACHFAGEAAGTSVKIVKRDFDPELAVGACYAEFLRVTGALPELRNAIEHQPTKRTTYEMEEEIPF